MTELDTHITETTRIDFEHEYEETEQLKELLYTAIGRIGLVGSQLELVQKSAVLALDLHQEDRRSYEPYVNHLLRVALRLIEFGVKDSNTIAAALLHDSLEDHPDGLIQKVPGEEVPYDEAGARTLGHRALQALTNEKVAEIVRELSNPILQGNEDKNAAYAAHMRHLTEHASLEALEVKISDFIDNTDAHGQENPTKRRALDYKQGNIYDIVLAALPRLVGRPSAASIPAMRQALADAKASAHSRLDTYIGTP